MLDKTEVATVTLPACKLAAGLKRVRYAISSEETRYYLCGIYVERDQDHVILTATDGHRLTSTKIPCATNGFSPFILPAAGVADILKSPIGKAKARGVVPLAEMHVAPGRVAFAFDGAWILDCEPIDDTFPDYRRVIPAPSNMHRVEIHRESLLRICSGVAACLGKAGVNPSLIRFAFRGDKLTLSAAGHIDTRFAGAEPIAVESSIKIPAAAEPFDIGFNPAYVRDALSVMSGEFVTLDVADAGSPALFIDADPNTVNVLMPMRL